MSTKTASVANRFARTKARTGTLAALAIAITSVLMMTGTGTAQAAIHTPLITDGDFSWRRTEVVRFANCAASEWFDAHKSGAGLTTCNSANSDPWWDESQLIGLGRMHLHGRQVAYANGNCPRASGFAYIKCYYVGGKKKGGIVMTVSARSSGGSGMEANVDWYYL